MWEHQSDGYSFWQNYFSDLGRTASWSGHGNPVASIPFNVSIGLLGLSQIPCFLCWNMLAPGSMKLLRASTVLGVLSALGIVGVGLTPVDTLPVGHTVAVSIWLVALVPALGLYSVAALLSGRRAYWRFVLTILLAALASVHILQAMQPHTTATVGTQKVLVYYIVAWFAATGTEMHLRTRRVSVG